MYQKHICRPTIDQQLKYYVHKAEITYDERVAYIDSVCAVLIESRFGPGHPVQFVKLSNRPEPGGAAFFDLIDNDMVPYYALLPLGRGRHQANETENRQAKQRGLLAAGPNGSNRMAPLVSNLGRGSP